MLFLLVFMLDLFFPIKMTVIITFSETSLSNYASKIHHYLFVKPSVLTTNNSMTLTFLNFEHDFCKVRNFDIHVIN